VWGETRITGGIYTKREIHHPPPHYKLCTGLGKHICKCADCSIQFGKAGSNPALCFTQPSPLQWRAFLFAWGGLYLQHLMSGAKDLSTLKPKQERFAQMYVELGNASEAYRAAYDSKAKAETVNVEASKMLKDPKIALRVQELRDELEEKSLWKRLDSIKTLASIADGTDEEAKPSDRVNAVKALNTMHGWDAPVKIDNRHRVIDDGSNEW